MKKFLKSRKALILAAVIMAGILVFNGSFFGLVHNLFMIKKLNKELADIDKEYARLTAVYDKIQRGDTSYIDDAARTRYNMSAPGEYEIRVQK